MAGYYTESNYENAVLQLINEGLGYNYVYGPEVERDYHSPLYQNAQEILSLLQLICSQRETDNPVDSTNTPVQDVSAADEIRKFKALMEEGIITEEEFLAKKKQLLGL